MIKEAETLGSLWFSTTKTFKPLFKVNSSGWPRLIFGAGPGSGCLERSTCAIAAVVKKQAINNGYLSEKQLRALNKVYKRYKNKGKSK